MRREALTGERQAIFVSDPAGTTTLDAPRSARARESQPQSRSQLALALVWCASEPERVGEVLLPGGEPAWFGRQATGTDEPRLNLLRQHPGRNEPTAPLLNPFLSRRHLCIERAADGSLAVRCTGRRGLRVGETEVEHLQVHRGDVFEVWDLYVFACVEREPLCEGPERKHPFGGPDEYGIVGESPAVWGLRRRVDFAAGRAAHVLITGPSGAGKELVARALHSGSTRTRKALVARNAATFPSGLIDAELFGNMANYPNPGMPERAGLVGQADGSTLFLDEIGELPNDLQAHLLRVLDSGEYQRLGDARPRVADFRLIAATNRAAEDLKEDLAARLTLRVEVPGLNERIEDIPLIARQLVRRMAARDPQLGERFLQGWNGRTGELRIAPALMRALLQHDYATHVRELEALLWCSLQSSRAGVLELTDDVRARWQGRKRLRPQREITLTELRSALARHGGVKNRVWRDLGLSSRHALLRLMRKLGET